MPTGVSPADFAKTDRHENVEDTIRGGDRLLQVCQGKLQHIAAILERVPSLRFHLDSGHAKLERGHDRWDEYLDCLGHKLLHVHLSDNDGTADQHLPLGAVRRATTNWPRHIKKLKSTGYDGTITLEVFTPQREYLLLSRDLLRKWWTEA